MPQPTAWGPRLLYSLIPILWVAAVLKSLAVFSNDFLGLGSAADRSSAKDDIVWYAPNKGKVNSLEEAISSSGTYGFIFNSSSNPKGVKYSTYNYCNAPHVRVEEYVRLPGEFKLRYVEVIQRHHKRTPYASNLFPKDDAPWSCNDAVVSQYAEPYSQGNRSAGAHLVSEDHSSMDPVKSDGAKQSCSFPQISRGGLDDAWQHGRDLSAVYHDLLRFLPSNAIADGAVRFRVTNNPITSQVAKMVLSGMFNLSRNDPVPLHIQPPGVDSLEPSYTCPAAKKLAMTFGVGSHDHGWLEHLKRSKDLFSGLDEASGVPQDAVEWHRSWDHYFDNLSSRLCHQMGLPAHVTITQAHAVFRLGLWEYSYLHRDSRDSLEVARAAFGVWVAELAANLREASRGNGSGIVYRHNVAHDGSLAMLLSLLQVETMAWPALGAELVFELYEALGSNKAASGESRNSDRDGGRDSRGGHYLRVLWGGQVLVSSSPQLGSVTQLPLAAFLDYVDRLVGRHADKVAGLCQGV